MSEAPPPEKVRFLDMTPASSHVQWTNDIPYTIYVENQQRVMRLIIVEKQVIRNNGEVTKQKQI